jgi:hypothetical protein
VVLTVRGRVERLRELGHQAPSSAAWAGICEALHTPSLEPEIVEVLAYAEELLSGWPSWLRVLEGRWSKILHSSHVLMPGAAVAREVTLDLGRLKQEGLEVALWSATAARWEALTLQATRGSAKMWDWVAGAPNPVSLRVLSWELQPWGWAGAGVSGAQVERLLGSPRAAGLRALSLRWVRLAPSGLAALGSSLPGSLESLSLLLDQASSPWLGRLLAGGGLEGLRSLSVGPLAEADEEALSAHEGLGGLEALRLVAAPVGGGEAPPLSRCRRRAGLRALALEGYAGSEATLGAVCGELWPSLEALELALAWPAGADVGASLGAVRRGAFPSLRRLSVSAALREREALALVGELALEGPLSLSLPLVQATEALRAACAGRGFTLVA